MPAIFFDTDDFKLLLVINNLVSNALKFTREADKIRFVLRETESSVLIAIKDTGIGIPDTLQPFLFEKQGPARRTGLHGEKSVGLGLPICRNMIIALGGEIWIESEEGKGTNVFLQFQKPSA
ncbi:MAG: ATP-binding protein [Bacteroidota bacterium]